MGDLCSHCGSGLHATEDCTARQPRNPLREALQEIAKGSRHVLGAERKYTAPELRGLAQDAIGKSDPPKHPTTLFAIGYDLGWKAMLRWIEINEPSLFNEWVDEAKRDMQEQGPPQEWRGP